MRPVTQTKRGGPDAPPDERGDCFDACLASVLEVGIADVPCPHGDTWWDDAQAAVARHGYRIVLAASHHDAPLTVAEVAEWLGPVYWIAGVPSLNLGAYDDGRPVMHVIVMRGDEVAHDPSLGERYPLGPRPALAVHDVLLLVPFEPVAVAA